MDNKLSITVDDTHSGQSVEASVVHVGDCGIFVESSEIFGVGTAVSCRFQDGEKSLILPGKVTWTIADPEDPDKEVTRSRKRQTTKMLFKLGEERPYSMSRAAVLSGGMGIRFDHLSEADLRFLIAIKIGLDRNTKTVRMCLNGISDEVITQGVPTYNGVEVEAQIPFLEIGSSVKFSLGDEGTSYQGKVLSVVLDSDHESAIPLLRVALETNAVSEPTERMVLQEEPGASDQRDRKQSFYGITYERATREEADPITTYRPCVTKIETPIRNTGVSYAAIALIAAMAGAWTTWMVVNKESVAVNDPDGQTEQVAASQTRFPSHINIKPIKESRSQKPSTIRSETTQQTTPRTDIDRPIVFKYDKPRISVNGDSSSVLIPLKGSDRGLREYQLSTPGIAVTLPDAQTLIPYKNYGVYRGLIKRVWVRPSEPGTQVRVITAWQKVRHHITFTPKGLKIVLTP